MTERFERTGEWRSVEAGDWFERECNTREPLLCINPDVVGKRWILRRVNERTIPTRYVYAGEGQPMQVDLDEPICDRAAVIEECAQAVDALADNMFAYGAVAADPNRKEHYNWMGQFYADAASAVRSLKGAR